MLFRRMSRFTRGKWNKKNDDDDDDDDGGEDDAEKKKEYIDRDMR